MFKVLIRSIIVILIIPTIVLAATPTAFMQNAQVIGTGKQIKAYRVPTQDEKGIIRYYDLTVNLNVLKNGKIDASKSSVKAVPSKLVLSTQFLPGTYTDANNRWKCTMDTSVLKGGRTETALACNKTSGPEISISWASGPIKGHPFELDLKAAGIDKITGYDNYAWGRVGYSYLTEWGCFRTNHIISARQAGNLLNLTCYGESNTALCGTTLIKK